MDLTSVRERLAAARGPRFWRSLEELAGSEAFRDLVMREFPRQASEWGEGLDRRRFLQLSSASLALAGLTACTRQPTERIVPYVKQPEEVIPGRPLYYATARTLGGYALGLIVESHEGRPTKVEGNTAHPASLGAADAIAQASVLGLYDPDRSQVLTHLGGIQPWGALVKDLQENFRAQRALGGAGLRILTETVTSPTLAAQLRTLLALLPKARWHQWDPACRDNARAGARLAFGEVVDIVLDLPAADVVVALDADLLAEGPGAVRYARDFASRRRVRSGRTEMNRLYVAESAPSCTGTVADHRVAVRADALATLALAIASEAGLPGAHPGAPLDPQLARFAAAAGEDLKAHRGSGLVVAGDGAPAEVHALAHAMNAMLGNLGRTVRTIAPVEAEPVDQAASLGALAGEMRAGRVDMLLILGANPVFTAPADLDFTRALEKVRLRVHLGLEADETAEYCHWHIPQAHELEAWSDARAFDGTASIVQPLIEPLYDGKSAHELLSVLSDETPRPGYDIVRSQWRGARPEAEFEGFWRRALHDGVIEGTASPARIVGVRSDAAGEISRKIGSAGRGDGIELVLRPDPSIHDGRFANNGWLQEVPKPLTTLTWDNAALLSPATAAALGVETGDIVSIASSGASVAVPALVQPGLPERSITLHFGNGRRRVGRVGAGAGVDAYPIRRTSALWSVPSVTVAKTGEHRALAQTQEHFAMEGRHLVRVGTLEEYRREPEFAHKLGGGHAAAHRPLLPGWEYKGHAWGLSVDLGACIGCNACVVACQAENNIPVVGKDQVLRGREMHWIRIDRYFEGPPEAPAMHNQPVMCMHCEQAPCEVVCPVGATTHSSEGLNDMVYNRCVGTRYCSNNCPYKVRRFNFLRYNDDTTPVLKLLRNPDVTVRSRGVMEKCTYCVQRINEARIESEKQGRPLRDGEITTACQQSCPSEAIVFGDLNDPASRIASLRAEPASYTLLDLLDTRPRTSYLAKVRNPNPELDAGRAGGGEPGEGH